MPSNITKIPDETFFYCDELKEIELPNLIKQIGDTAFCNCHNLEEIILPNSVEKISDCAFASCNKLKFIDIPESVSYIGIGTLYCCNALKNIKFPSSINYLDEKTLEGCVTLEKITVNAKCHLSDILLHDCKNIKNIYITQESFDLSPDFVKKYSDKIKIINKSLDDLLAEGKSLKEISKIYKEEER